MAIRVKYHQDEQQDPRQIDNERYLDEFLQGAEGTERFAQMVQMGHRRFPLDFDVLRRDNNQLVQQLMRRPTGLIRHMHETLKRMRDTYSDASETGKKYAHFPDKQPTYRVSFEGNLGRNFVTPRGLTANLVNNLVAVQGIVTKMTLVRPKLIESLHCIEIGDANGKTYKSDRRTYWDGMDPAEETHLNPVTVVPRKDTEGHPMIMEFGYSVFRDTQILTIQELPERTPTGQLPRSVEIIFEDDLVDKAKPGDRIVVTGVYKCFGMSTTYADGSFRSALLATNIHQLQYDINQDLISDEDVKMIELISKKQDLLSYMSNSIAPSIYGHEYIKRAVLLLLVGGSEKNLSTGTHLRGTINMLLVGDPSTAKSQVLRYLMHVAPLAINTTGRGTSSVGLTASVRRDQETGENVLEAGAMVLADGGIVLIDEFDKMNDADRVAIHEVMEQQTVTIAKAGIHCSLNARCSVVAAANPIYGEYQKDMPPTKNIGLPDSLLSRFDLLFIVLDEKREDLDRKVAERVTKNHRYRGTEDYQGQFGAQESNVVTQPIVVKQEQGPYVQFQSNLYSADQRDLLSQSFLKKYILYAKTKIQRTRLEEDAIEELTEQWVQMRQQDLTSNAQVRILPITIRSLESLIRLASAHAKLRLSGTVTLEDVKIAIMLMKHTLWGDEVNDNEDNIEGMGIKIQEESEIQEEEILIPEKRATRSAQKQTKKQDEQQIKSVVQGMKKFKIDEEEQVKQLFKIEQLGSIQVNEKQISEVFKQLITVKNNTQSDQINIDAVWLELQKKSDKKVSSYEELYKCLIQLESRGKLQLDTSKNIVDLY